MDRREFLNGAAGITAAVILGVDFVKYAEWKTNINQQAQAEYDRTRAETPIPDETGKITLVSE